MAERRIDPVDGVAYTWEEFSTYYTGKYKKKAIEAYWEECKVKKGRGTKAAAAPTWKAKAEAKPTKAEPKTALKALLVWKPKVKQDLFQVKAKPQASLKDFRNYYAENVHSFGSGIQETLWAKFPQPKPAPKATVPKEKLPNLLGGSLCAGGNCGLGSKEFAPSHVKAVDNLNEAYAENPDVQVVEKGGEVPQLGSTTQGVREVDVETELQTQVLRDELGKRCFVLLRDNTILNLSRGCTALDAAFKIHSEVGLHMLYPEINGKEVAPSYELQNGDRVNIVIGNDAVPQREWLAYAFLRLTRKKLAGYFRGPKTTEEWWEEFAAFHREDY